MEEREASEASSLGSDQNNAVQKATDRIFGHGEKPNRDPDQKTEHRASDQKVVQLIDSDGKADRQDSDHEDATRKETSNVSDELPSRTPRVRTPNTGVAILDQKQASTVSATSAEGPGTKRVSSSRLRMEHELERMKQADENERLRDRARRRKEVKKAIAAMYAQKKNVGVTLTPDVEESRAAIRAMMREEERMALEKDQKQLRKETKALQRAIDEKYGLKDKKQGHDILALAESFYQGKVKDVDGLPEQVRRELTRSEIQDLKMVFDMFDVKGRGYITANDVKRAASMLGFKASKEVFKDMIEEVTGEKTGRVNFSHFLQFVVRGQGDGDDPLEDIMQGFRMLDNGQKGYLTADDLRQAAESQKLPFSNRAIREMIQEADVTGDGKITSDEFIHIMLQTSMFKTTR